MLWGQKLIVYTDHKNLMQDTLGITSDCVYRWRIILEEYGPEIIYIKGIHNTVADAISRLDYDPTKNYHAHMNYVMSKAEETGTGACLSNGRQSSNASAPACRIRQKAITRR